MNEPHAGSGGDNKCAIRNDIGRNSRYLNKAAFAIPGPVGVRTLPCLKHRTPAPAPTAGALVLTNGPAMNRRGRNPRYVNPAYC
ncbi:hypothetical protein EVAR_28652_1 [Eumeta japonica]|uniref:Uncharacterized protein n=1 Tax=Eumeta variegata TaxID=151549 RepID=A0A4C2AB70_EUMVA|nr:hypothetical protein EVAR_28652_1 [Eumeta japonica]